MEVCQRVREVAAVRAASHADRPTLESGLRSIAVVRSWLSAAEAELAARLAACASFPEQAIAQAGRGSQGEAVRVLERSGTLGATPALAGALDDGAVTAGHVDAVTKVAKGLEGAERAALLERADQLVGVARHGSVTQFRKRLEHEADRLRSDDGSARFERQQRAARVRRWTDADGMWCLAGRFDPLTGVRLNARLTAEIEAAFAESVPDGCPTDPQAKNEFLAACALARIFEDGGSAQRAGRPEFIVVIEVDAPNTATDDNDTDIDNGTNNGDDIDNGTNNGTNNETDGNDAGNDTDGNGGGTGSRSSSNASEGSRSPGAAAGAEPPTVTATAAEQRPGTESKNGTGSKNGTERENRTGPGNGRRPRVDWGLPVEVPWSVLMELFGSADVHPVIVRNGVVLYAPGELNLGRTTRLANRAQRRALRSLYATCAIPGCATRFERCKMHHLHWWRHGGHTDLHNLLPLCVHHHTKIHRDGWVITLDAARTLTLRLPDGSVRTTGPPGRCAA